MPAEEKELKTGLVRQIVRFAAYLPELLELIGTPRPVARAVGHAVRLVPAVRNGEVDDARNAVEELVGDRFASILASQQELGERCQLLERENTKIKYDLADATSQVQVLKSETLALKTEVESLRQRNFYLTYGVLAVFVVEIAAIAWRLLK